VTSISNISNANIINNSLERIQESNQRLSSGLRINSASDDAAGLAISTSFSTRVDAFDQSARNANDGISLAQTADGSLSSITENFQRLRELTVQAANGTLNDSDRQALNTEAKQLTAEINRISETANFNGKKLLSEDSELGLQVGPDAGDVINVGTDNLQQKLQELGLDDIDLSSQSGAQAALGKIDESLAEVNVQRSEFGALNNRLSSTVSNLQQSSIDSEQARSRIADADFAKEVAEQVRNEILLKSGIAVQTQANQRSDLVLQLLTGS